MSAETDAVQQLVGQANALADKVETLVTTVRTTKETARAAQAEIDDALAQILQRTGPVPDVDVAALVNTVGFASKRLIEEIGKVDDVTTQVGGFGAQAKSYADAVQSKAGSPASGDAGEPTSDAGSSTGDPLVVTAPPVITEPSVPPSTTEGPAPTPVPSSTGPVPERSPSPDEAD